MIKPEETDFNAGDLVKYIPSPSSIFKWEKYVETTKRKDPGIVVRELGKPFSEGLISRRFEICWHGGQVTEEWISHLEPFDNSLTV